MIWDKALLVSWINVDGPKQTHKLTHKLKEIRRVEGALEPY
jgi:hypothetical protein